MENKQGWSATEDKILKMGVRKYGIHKWWKVATMLHKTPLECKHRFDNMDRCSKECDFKASPSDKECDRRASSCNDTPWNKDDSIKLLRLQKSFSGQYNLISSIMRRSAAECVRMHGILCLGREIYSHPNLASSTAKNSDASLLMLARARVRNKKTRKDLKAKNRGISS